MALTPDDVVTKQFQHVRFKEGFDPEEVDDFLDEIVAEWRKTIAENEELKAKLASYEEGGAPAATVTAEEVVDVQPEETVPAAPAEAPAAAGDDAEIAEAAGIIAIAKRVHDEYIANGQAKHDQLVSEAQATAARLVSESEATQRELTYKAERERDALEGRISELRQFEHDYRAQLRSYIEGQLHELESTENSGAQQ